MVLRHLPRLTALPFDPVRRNESHSSGTATPTEASPSLVPAPRRLDGTREATASQSAHKPQDTPPGPSHTIASNQ